MPNALNWELAGEDRGTVLTSQMDSVGAGARSNAGTEIANQTNLDQQGILELNTTHGTAPAAGGYYDIHAVYALDGTNYQDGSSTVDPGPHTWVASAAVRAVNTPQQIQSTPFTLLPFPVKFILVNRCSTSMATGNTARLWTFNDEVQ